MGKTFRLWPVALCFAAVAVFVPGCRDTAVQASGQASGNNLSGPPQFSQRWGARLPRQCSKVTSPPNASVAAALVQCTMETEGRENETLMQDVKVEVGGARPFLTVSDYSLDDVDPSAKIYPLRGSQTMYICGEVSFFGKGKQCSSFPSSRSEGRCWHTKFNDWKCTMAGVGGGQQMINQPGPTTY